MPCTNNWFEKCKFYHSQHKKIHFAYHLILLSIWQKWLKKKQKLKIHTHTHTDTQTLRSEEKMYISCNFSEKHFQFVNNIDGWKLKLSFINHYIDFKSCVVIPPYVYLLPLSLYLSRSVVHSSRLTENVNENENEMNVWCVSNVQLLQCYKCAICIL